MANETNVYVADTYALVELLLGNPAYAPYLKKRLITTDFALVELYFAILRRYGKDRADSDFALYAPMRQTLLQETLTHAAQLRFEHKKLSLSYADCVGWSLAQQLGVPFLTGDKAFANLPGVAFVR